MSVRGAESGTTFPGKGFLSPKLSVRRACVHRRSFFLPPIILPRLVLSQLTHLSTKARIVFAVIIGLLDCSGLLPPVFAMHAHWCSVNVGRPWFHGDHAGMGETRTAVLRRSHDVFCRTGVLTLAVWTLMCQKDRSIECFLSRLSSSRGSLEVKFCCEIILHTEQPTFLRLPYRKAAGERCDRSSCSIDGTDGWVIRSIATKITVIRCT